MPWLILGDFNMVSSIEERKHGENRHYEGINLFNSFINGNNLVNLPLQGKEFTWANTTAMARLDRFLFNLNWSQKYPNFNQIALTSLMSYHNSIILECTSSFSIFEGFRYETTWINNLEPNDIVEEHLKSRVSVSFKGLFEKKSKV